jgi:hypothetical protein
MTIAKNMMPKGVRAGAIRSYISINAYLPVQAVADYLVNHIHASLRTGDKGQGSEYYIIEQSDESKFSKYDED